MSFPRAVDVIRRVEMEKVVTVLIVIAKIVEVEVEVVSQCGMCVVTVIIVAMVKVVVVVTILKGGTFSMYHIRVVIVTRYSSSIIAFSLGNVNCIMNVMCTGFAVVPVDVNSLTSSSSCCSQACHLVQVVGFDMVQGTSHASCLDTVMLLVPMVDTRWQRWIDVHSIMTTYGSRSFTCTMMTTTTATITMHDGDDGIYAYRHNDDGTEAHTTTMMGRIQPLTMGRQRWYSCMLYDVDNDLQTASAAGRRRRHPFLLWGNDDNAEN
ncbi:hypothetical protein J3A83DRAFT_4187158 [Scleroderma citrinum]